MPFIVVLCEHELPIHLLKIPAGWSIVYDSGRKSKLDDGVFSG